MTDSTASQNFAYEVACAAVELLGDQVSAMPGPGPATARLRTNGIYFTITPDEEEGVLRIRNVDPNYTPDDTRLLPSGPTAVIAQHIHDVIGEIL
jgi:hypothetical protein